ncbi:MAG TPA: glycosyltransferase 87 family protein [Solirubrobacteraceae bacterium]|nr:glycosyltransferase 87 family protein [Solirubrobacteraceae bacterium]
MPTTGACECARDLAAPACLALAGAFLLAVTGLQTMAFTDYEGEAEPALLALRHGHVWAFLHHLPAYGGSLILRAPFALLPAAWHGGDLALFRTMAAPCLLAAVALAVVLHHRARGYGAGGAAAWLVLLLTAANPLTLRALETGHPEELLGGALCVAAGLAAIARRPLLAGVLVGAAMANEPWAVVAVAPIMLMLPDRRRRALACSVGVAALLVAPMFLLSGGALTSTVAVAHGSGAIFQPWQLWWFLGDHGHRVMGVYGEKVGYRTPPLWVTRVSHLLVVLVPVAAALLVARRRPTLGPAAGFALLALALQLRCLLDTWDAVYYALPACLALVAWEVHARRPPLVALTTVALTWSTFELLPKAVSPDVQAAVYLAWSLPLVCGLGLAILRPVAWTRVTSSAAKVLRRELPTLARAYAMTCSSLGSDDTTSAPSSVTITRSSMRTPTAPGT